MSVSRQVHEDTLDELDMVRAALEGMMNVKRNSPRPSASPALEKRCEDAECSLKEKCQEVDHFKRQLAYADSSNEQAAKSSDGVNYPALSRRL